MHVPLPQSDLGLSLLCYVMCYKGIELGFLMIKRDMRNCCDSLELDMYICMYVIKVVILLCMFRFCWC